METGKSGVVTATPAKPKVTCSERIFDGHMGMHKCSITAAVERKGYWYCKRHDPVSVAERDRIRKQKLDEQSRARTKEWKRHIAALASFDEARALVEAVERLEGYHTDSDVEDALAKARDWRKAAGEHSGTLEVNLEYAGRAKPNSPVDPFD